MVIIYMGQYHTLHGMVTLTTNWLRMFLTSSRRWKYGIFLMNVLLFYVTTDSNNMHNLMVLFMISS